MRHGALASQLHHEPVLVQLLDGFRVDVGHREIVLPAHAQRVLAFLAILRPGGASQRRSTLAQRLWGECPNHRAQASLRTSIWRIRQADERLVHANRERVHLGPLVEVDVQLSLQQAARLLTGDDAPRPDDVTITGLVGDLLPDWEDDWLVLERERIRLIRIYALEALSRRLCRLGLMVSALDAAYAAIAAEPLRESAHAALIDIHLAEGNAVQARRQLTHYAKLLWDEMQLKPSPALIARIEKLGG